MTTHRGVHTVLLADAPAGGTHVIHFLGYGVQNILPAKRSQVSNTSVGSYPIFRGADQFQHPMATNVDAAYGETDRMNFAPLLVEIGTVKFTGCVKMKLV